MNEDAYSRKRFNRYCRMALSAVMLGVPLDDILAETSRYHGENFSVSVKQKLFEML